MKKQTFRTALLMLALITIATFASSCKQNQTVYKVKFDREIQLVDIEDTTNTMFVDGLKRIKFSERDFTIILATEFDRDTVVFPYLGSAKISARYENGNLLIP